MVRINNYYMHGAHCWSGGLKWSNLFKLPVKVQVQVLLLN